MRRGEKLCKSEPCCDDGHYASQWHQDSWAKEMCMCHFIHHSVIHHVCESISNVVELTVPYERSLEMLASCCLEKEAKYSSLATYGWPLSGTDTIWVVGLAVGSGGMISTATRERLRTLGIAQLAARLGIAALWGSARIWGCHSGQPMDSAFHSGRSRFGWSPTT